MKPDIWHEPRVIEKFPFKKGREVWIVEAPFSMARDKPEIIGTFVTFGGQEVWKVVGVERHMLGVPIYTGERFGLVVERSSRDAVPDPSVLHYTGNGEATRAFPGGIKFEGRR